MGTPIIKRNRFKGRVKNYEKCSDICRNNMECIMWSHEKKSKRCFIYSLLAKQGNVQEDTKIYYFVKN